MQCPKCGLSNLAGALRCQCGYCFQTSSPSTLANLSDQPLASLGQRVAGQLLDAMVLYAGVILVLFVAAVDKRVSEALLIPAVAFLFLYTLLADGLHGQSLGKRIMKTAVVDATTGDPCTFWPSFTRNSVMCLGVLDWMFIFEKNRRRLGDRAAGTIVVKTPRT